MKIILDNVPVMFHLSFASFNGVLLMTVSLDGGAAGLNELANVASEGRFTVTPPARQTVGPLEKGEYRAGEQHVLRSLEWEIGPHPADDRRSFVHGVKGGVVV